MMIQGNIDDYPEAIEPGSVACAMTSPPYWGKRTYGDSPDELGQEDLLAYVQRFTLQARNVRRALRPDGVYWVNIGDTSAGSGGAGGDHALGSSKERIAGYRQGRPVSVFPIAPSTDGGLEFDDEPWRVGLRKLGDGQRCLVPALIAWHMQGDGWILRSWIVWDKGRDKPEDLGHVRRPRERHEVILMFTRSMDYRFWPDRMKETGDVWRFAPSSTRKGADGHSAVFPNELAERCILPSTEPGDLVFDPYAGSGTVPTVAVMLGRRGIGVDLYHEPNKVTRL